MKFSKCIFAVFVLCASMSQPTFASNSNGGSGEILVDLFCGLFMLPCSKGPVVQKKYQPSQEDVLYSITSRKARAPRESLESAYVNINASLVKLPMDIFEFLSKDQEQAFRYFPIALMQMILNQENPQIVVKSGGDSGSLITYNNPYQKIDGSTLKITLNKMGLERKHQFKCLQVTLEFSAGFISKRSPFKKFNHEVSQDIIVCDDTLNDGGWEVVKDPTIFKYMIQTASDLQSFGESDIQWFAGRK